MIPGRDGWKHNSNAWRRKWQFCAWTKFHQNCFLSQRTLFTHLGFVSWCRPLFPLLGQKPLNSIFFRTVYQSCSRSLISMSSSDAGQLEFYPIFVRNCRQKERSWKFDPIYQEKKPSSCLIFVPDRTTVRSFLFSAILSLQRTLLQHNLHLQ